MSEERGKRAGTVMAGVFDADEVQEVLRGGFYRPQSGAPAPARKPAKAKRKPDHYEVICISLYKEDLARLDQKVSELKRSGHPKMSRSALIRFALDQVDSSRLPPRY